MQIKFNNRDLKLLVDAIEDINLIEKIKHAEKTGEYIAKGQFPTGRYVLELTNHEREILLEGLGNLFAETGIDNLSEPNRIGFQIEGIIDLLMPDLLN